MRSKGPVASVFLHAGHAAGRLLSRGGGADCRADGGAGGPRAVGWKPAEAGCRLRPPWTLKARLPGRTQRGPGLPSCLSGISATSWGPRGLQGPARCPVLSPILGAPDPMGSRERVPSNGPWLCARRLERG